MKAFIEEKEEFKPVTVTIKLETETELLDFCARVFANIESFKDTYLQHQHVSNKSDPLYLLMCDVWEARGYPLPVR